MASNVFMAFSQHLRSTVYMPLSPENIWQRLKPMEKLARMLIKHLDGILNYCRTKVPLGSDRSG
jgi:transposase